MIKQRGQALLILILIMTVALAIGLSIVQKSLVDVSTASKVEQSSRAFSAAEAGIEKALQQSGVNSTTVEVPNLGNAATARANDTGLIPAIPKTGRQEALEYPALSRDDIGQVWLADYTSTANPPPAAYTQSSLDIYWGNSATDQMGLELTLVYVDGSTLKYTSLKWYLDQKDRGNNGFITPASSGGSLICDGGQHPDGPGATYQCKYTLTGLPNNLMLLRFRPLYNKAAQPLAVQANGGCGKDCSLPPQARRITSTGFSGETQRKVQVFQEYLVVPPYFDFAIFSAGSINK